MFLFFGTRPGKEEVMALNGVTCPYCGQKDTLTVSKTSNWFHLFWIKLFKISTLLVAECTHCRKVYFEDEFSEEMRREIARA